MGVMTMKMIRSTSITSTMGVTLISDTGGLSLTFLNSIFMVVLLELGRNRGEACASPPNQLAGFRSQGLLTGGAGATLRALQEVVDQLRAGVTHLNVEGFNLVGEIVEGPDGGESDEQTDSGGHEGFRNTARDSAETGGLFGGDSLERVDDANDGSEQTDEGSGGTNGRQTADAAFQFRAHNGLGAIQGALGRIDFLAGNFG